MIMLRMNNLNGSPVAEYLEFLSLSDDHRSTGGVVVFVFMYYYTPTFTASLLHLWGLKHDKGK